MQVEQDRTKVARFLSDRYDWLDRHLLTVCALGWSRWPAVKSEQGQGEGKRSSRNVSFGSGSGMGLYRDGLIAPEPTLARENEIVNNIFI